MKSYIVMVHAKHERKFVGADGAKKRQFEREENERQRSMLYPILESMGITWTKLTNLIPAVVVDLTDEQAAQLRNNTEICVEENRKHKLC